MKLEDYKARVDAVVSDKFDIEMEHIEADNLVWEFVEECAARNSPVGQKATELMRMAELRHNWWYA